MTPSRCRNGQTLAFVLLALVALALVAAVATRLIATQQLDRTDRMARSSLAGAFANRLREASATVPDTPTWTPVRRLPGDSSTAITDVNGDALQVARSLHLLVRDLGLGADGVGFEAAGDAPTVAEDLAYDAGWVLAHRRSLAGDRFASVADLASVVRGGTPMWGGSAASELSTLLAYLEASPAPRAAIAREGALVDLNGDPLELARLLHQLLEVATGPDGLPLGRNGVGIELDLTPPTTSDLAPSTDGKLADVVAIVRARLARAGGRFTAPEDLAVVPQLLREAGTIRAGAPIWGPAERWELERLARWVTARDEPARARRVELEHAAREVLAAAFAVHLADLVASGTLAATDLADAWIERRRSVPAPTALSDFAAFLAAHGPVANTRHLTRFSIGPDARHVAAFTMVELAPALAPTATYREGDGDTANLTRLASARASFTAPLVPARLSTLPLAPVPPEIFAGDPFALALRGGRPLTASGDRLPVGAAESTGAVSIPAGKRVFAWRIWLEGDAEDPDIQALALYDGALWRARSTGGVEIQLDLEGSLGSTWIPALAGLDPDEPVVALAYTTGSALYALDAAGSVSAWDSGLERWAILAGPSLVGDDLVSALCCARVAGTDRLYAGTRTGRVFHSTGGAAWSELAPIAPDDPPRILALATIDPTTHALAAGALGDGIWELTAGAPAWVRAGTIGSASVGSFATQASGELLAGTSAGVWTRTPAGVWGADPDLTASIASLWSDGVTPYAGTIGSGVYLRGAAGWTEIGGTEAAGKNVRAVATDAAGAVVWGATADGSIAIEASFSGSGAEVGAIAPARVPLAGGGPRRWAVTATLTGAADAVALRALRYRRGGSAATSIPVLLELSLEDSGASTLGEIRETRPVGALDPPTHGRGMRQER